MKWTTVMSTAIFATMMAFQVSAADEETSAQQLVEQAQNKGMEQTQDKRMEQGQEMSGEKTQAMEQTRTQTRERARKNEGKGTQTRNQRQGQQRAAGGTMGAGGRR